MTRCRLRYPARVTGTPINLRDIFTSRSAPRSFNAKSLDGPRQGTDSEFYIEELEQLFGEMFYWKM